MEKIELQYREIKELETVVQEKILVLNSKINALNTYYSNILTKAYNEIKTNQDKKETTEKGTISKSSNNKGSTQKSNVEKSSNKKGSGKGIKQKS